jgi:hypothetical protein
LPEGNAYEILVGYLKGKDNSEDLSVEGKVALIHFSKII